MARRRGSSGSPSPSRALYSPVAASEQNEDAVPTKLFVDDDDEETNSDDYVIGFGLATFMLLLISFTIAIMMTGITIYDYNVIQTYSPLVITPSSDHKHAVKPCIWPAQTSPSSDDDFLCPGNGYNSIQYYCPKLYTCDSLDVPYCHAKHFQCEEDIETCLSSLSELMYGDQPAEIDADTAPNYSIFLQVAGMSILILCVILYLGITAAVLYKFQHGLTAFSIAYGIVNIGTDLLFAGGMIFSYTTKNLCHLQCFDPSTNQILATMCSLKGIISLLSIIFGVFAAIQVACLLILLLICVILIICVMFCGIFVCFNSCYRSITRDPNSVQYELAELDDYVEW